MIIRSYSEHHLKGHYPEFLVDPEDSLTGVGDRFIEYKTSTYIDTYLMLKGAEDMTWTN